MMMKITATATTTTVTFDSCDCDNVANASQRERVLNKVKDNFVVVDDDDDDDDLKEEPNSIWKNMRSDGVQTCTCS